jgi:hypothetical protein
MNLDLSTKEAGVVAAMLEAGNGVLPAFTERLLQSAPDSFEFKQYGDVAFAIRCLRGENQPVSSITILTRLQRPDALGLVSSLATAPPPNLAEMDAEKVWECYGVRLAKRVLTETLAAMEAKPGDCAGIIARAACALEDVKRAARGTRDVLVARRYDHTKQPPELRPVFSLGGRPVSTPGNLTTITSAVKTGKSAVIGAMMAAAMTSRKDVDLLRFESSNERGLALCHFDSEQSPDDFWLSIRRALARAGLESPPPWFYSYYLTGLGPTAGLQCVREALATCAKQHGGVHSLLLDGAADLVTDVNDPKESNALVTELHGMTILYDCPAIGVIHLNPGTEKSRGHLGSQLERKAESNLRLDKDANGVTCIWSDKQRRAPIPRDMGPCFRWDNETGMHISTATRQITKDTAKADNRKMQAEDIFQGHPSMRYADIKNALMHGGAKESTAENRIADMARLKVIKKSVTGLYVLAS